MPPNVRPNLVRTRRNGFAAPPGPYGGMAPYGPAPAAAADPVKKPSFKVLAAEWAVQSPWLAAYYRSAPPWIDDLERGLGMDIYDKMALDEQIASSLRNVVQQTLADGLTIAPAVADKKASGYGDAKKWADRAQRMLDGLPVAVDALLREMLLYALSHGSKLAEQVYRRQESGPDAGLLMLDRLKPKPRTSTAYIVDAYENLIGIMPRLPGQALPFLASVSVEDLKQYRVLPPEKFAVLTHDMRDGVPLGNSILRCCYREWWEKLQTAKDFIQFLGQYASPGLVGVLSESDFDEPATDASGNPTGADQPSAEQQFANALLRYRNGSLIVISHGADVKLLQATGDGQAFLNKLERCDRAIDKAITGQFLAGQEAEHGTRAQAQVHQDTGGANLRPLKQLVADLITRQVFLPWMKYNAGAAAPAALCPKASLQAVEQQDKGALVASYGAAYQQGFLKNSQLPEVYAECGLPPASAEDLHPPEPPAPPANALAKNKPKPGGGAGGAAADAGFADDAAFALVRPARRPAGGARGAAGRPGRAAAGGPGGERGRARRQRGRAGAARRDRRAAGRDRERGGGPGPERDGGEVGPAGGELHRPGGHGPPAGGQGHGRTAAPGAGGQPHRRAAGRGARGRPASRGGDGAHGPARAGAGSRPRPRRQDHRGAAQGIVREAALAELYANDFVCNLAAAAAAGDLAVTLTEAPPAALQAPASGACASTTKSCW